MSIDEAITHCLEVADGQTEQGRCPECAEDHRQLAEWLRDYKRLKERESCDAISRQAVKEQMIKYGFSAPDMTVTEFVENLPPVNPQRTGHWIAVENDEMETVGYYCSECDLPMETEYQTKFCPNCGARMVEPQEGSGEE